MVEFEGKRDWCHLKHQVSDVSTLVTLKPIRCTSHVTPNYMYGEVQGRESWNSSYLAWEDFIPSPQTTINSTSHKNLSPSLSTTT
jgi:hypothetical protein